MSQFPEDTWTLVVWRYCAKCKAIRPPRAHHCSICGCCVLRMDHHCPWVGNCVALYNHKYFLNFILHAAIGCLIVSISFVTYCLDVGFKKMERANTHYVIVMMVASSLVLSLGGMFGFHAYLVMTNSSTHLPRHVLASHSPHSFSNWAMSWRISPVSLPVVVFLTTLSQSTRSGGGD